MTPFPSAFLRLPDAALDPQRRFVPLREGVDISFIYETENDGPSAAFLRYQPGAYVPEHEHVGFEHIFVLEGAQEDERGNYPKGSFVINAPGSRHSVRSPQGCLVLILWERTVRFV